MQEYPKWLYYPTSSAPPQWVGDFVTTVQAMESSISSRVVESLNSDRVLTHLAPGLRALGYKVERSKAAGDKIQRPVLFGENGVPRVRYEVDAVHDEHGSSLRLRLGAEPVAMRHIATWFELRSSLGRGT